MIAFPSLRNALACLALLLISTQVAQAALFVTIVQGLSGEAEYEERFNQQNQLISSASKSMTSQENIASFKGETANRADLLQHFNALSDKMTPNDRSAIYLIGHGSFDGEEYKFNIPGADLSNSDINTALSKLPGKNQFLVSMTSASGALLESIESDSYILITATRNGNEKNATEFGTHFASALSNQAADLNKNNNISIQEAFDFAEREVADFFDSTGRLATEHPQIRGDRADQFTLARLNEVAVSNANTNLLINPLVERRKAIDGQIDELQLRRQEFTNADYIEQLQSLIIESATVTEQIEQLGESGDSE